MEIFWKILLGLHIAAGIVTLLTGPVAIFYNFKNPRYHRLAGKAFFYAMLVVCFSSVAGYIKHPDRVFFQFLLGIAVIVLAGVMHGVRAMRFMHGQRPHVSDRVYTAMLGIFAIWMVVQAGKHFLAGTMIAFPILFAAFGISALVDASRFWRLLRGFDAVAHRIWYRLHVSSMLGAFTASTTAFTVNAAPFLPWPVQWFGPTLLLLPVQIYFGRKIGRRTAASRHMPDAVAE